MLQIEAETTVRLKKLLIPAFCLLHVAAISWWTLPQSFGGMVLANSEKNAFEAKLFKVVMLDGFPKITALLQNYIDVTGNQQYWDFFAPQSTRFHQYLSVCRSVNVDPEQGKISCKGEPLFTNLDVDFAGFKHFGSDRSRLYRLTENLVKLESPQLFEAFTHYFQDSKYGIKTNSTVPRLVLHRFELHPELKDLAKSGYCMDELIWVKP